MKNIFKTIIFVSAAAAALSSCSDFLTKEPANRISAGSYFSSETDLKMFTDGMLIDYLPGFTTVAIGDDAYTDFCATKSGSDFYHPGLWTAEQQSGWSTGNFSFIRKCNYMLENMTRAKGKVADETYYHYRGVAHFWRFRLSATFLGSTMSLSHPTLYCFTPHVMIANLFSTTSWQILILRATIVSGLRNISPSAGLTSISG